VSLLRYNVIFCMDGYCSLCVAVGLVLGQLWDLLYLNKVTRLGSSLWSAEVVEHIDTQEYLIMLMQSV
jgi:hypothetical protein